MPTAACAASQAFFPAVAFFFSCHPSTTARACATKPPVHASECVALASPPLLLASPPPPQQWRPRCALAHIHRKPPRHRAAISCLSALSHRSRTLRALYPLRRVAPLPDTAPIPTSPHPNAATHSCLASHRRAPQIEGRIGQRRTFSSFVSHDALRFVVRISLPPSPNP
jgi:hypothetical protein